MYVRNFISKLLDPTVLFCFTGIYHFIWLVLNLVYLNIGLMKYISWILLIFHCTSFLLLPFLTFLINKIVVIYISLLGIGIYRYYTFIISLFCFSELIMPSSLCNSTYLHKNTYVHLVCMLMKLSLCFWSYTHYLKSPLERTLFCL